MRRTGACARWRRVEIAPSAVHKIWRAHELKPHPTRTFKLSRDPNFAAKVEDIVGLHLDPPDRALVLAVDEKSQIQAADRTQPGPPIKKGRRGTMTHDYKRNGTTTLFGAISMLDGTVIGQCMPLIDIASPRASDDRRTGRAPPLIVDNHATHKTPAAKRWLQRHRRFHPHDLGLLAQYGRALLRRDHPKAHPPRRLHKRRRIGAGHHGLSQKPQRQPQAIPLDEVRNLIIWSLSGVKFSLSSEQFRTDSHLQFR